MRILGKQENIRVVQLSLFQGVAKALQAAPTIEMKASDNPALQNHDPDPIIFCTAFKKNRFYMVERRSISKMFVVYSPPFCSKPKFAFQFSKREPEDTKSADSDRDIFNEKPSKEEVMAATQAEGPKRVSDSAIIHTTMGDVHIKLFPVEYVFDSTFIECVCVVRCKVLTVFYALQMPQNSGELLRPQQERLLQRPHISSCH